MLRLIPPWCSLQTMQALCLPSQPMPLTADRLELHNTLFGARPARRIAALVHASAPAPVAIPATDEGRQARPAGYAQQRVGVRGASSGVAPHSQQTSADGAHPMGGRAPRYADASVEYANGLAPGYHFAPQRYAAAPAPTPMLAPAPTPMLAQAPTPVLARAQMPSATLAHPPPSALAAVDLFGSVSVCFLHLRSFVYYGALTMTVLISFPVPQLLDPLSGDSPVVDTNPMDLSWLGSGDAGVLDMLLRDW